MSRSTPKTTSRRDSVTVTRESWPRLPLEAGPRAAPAIPPKKVSKMSAKPPKPSAEPPPRRASVPPRSYILLDSASERTS